MIAVRVMGNRQIEIVEAEEPKPNRGRLAIDVKASGICGSEMPAYRGAQPRPSNNGHEVAGVVVHNGGSARFQVGARVGVHAVWGCGACPECELGRYTRCPRLRHSGGGHSERVSAPEHVCQPLPDDMSFEEGVLYTGDGLGVPYRVSQRIGETRGEWVCITGAGPIGLGNALVQAFLGARVVLLDMNARRLEFARRLGAEATLNLNETDRPDEAVMETAGGRPRYCIEASGKPQALRFLLDIARKGGTVMAVGEQGELPVSPSRDLIHKDLTLMGSLYYHFSDYPHMLAMRQSGLQAARLIGRRYPLQEAASAFQAFDEGAPGKLILNP